MLCASITTFAPLRENGCGPGKRVGVVGVGGLGHFALLFYKALGADQVVAISRGLNKKEDALKMGRYCWQFVVWTYQTVRGCPKFAYCHDLHLPNLGSFPIYISTYIPGIPKPCNAVLPWIFVDYQLKSSIPQTRVGA